MLLAELDDLAPARIEHGIAGLSFGRDGLAPSTFHQGPGRTGQGAEDRSGLYVDTRTGLIWYNPTTAQGGDTLEVAHMTTSTAALLEARDIVFGG
ncbi:hypothetical protein OOT46_24380 [Aquabacterium sp. A7-Y]|uniref:hypothetical protein n=1 Tax=Aquabacterium sp. A7-Y TaxID=1349605 RepID=UPI00223E24A9|nr:hypothetical protein [Aquabacterium sp. A7-Y]MCW7540963.1 hypothetical protein [Aquabacterium sp. A7-Y]